MAKQWIYEIDNDWVNESLIDVENCYTNSDHVWDAQGFGGALAFAEFLIEIKKDISVVNPDLDLGFLDDEKLHEKVVFSLKHMLHDQYSKELFEAEWDYFEDQINACLLNLVG